jgi:hypothetical protein
MNSARAVEESEGVTERGERKGERGFSPGGSQKRRERVGLALIGDGDRREFFKGKEREETEP